jgi:hypothetical protein
MAHDYYQYGLADRRRLMADVGFVRDDSRIWSHADGRAIGEGVAAALTDKAFFLFLKIDPPESIIREVSAEKESRSELECR